MNRWHAITDSQPMLPVVAARAFGTDLRNSEQTSKPRLREAPTSA